MFSEYSFQFGKQIMFNEHVRHERSPSVDAPLVLSIISFFGAQRVKIISSSEQRTTNCLHLDVFNAVNDTSLLYPLDEGIARAVVCDCETQGFLSLS